MFKREVYSQNLRLQFQILKGEASNSWICSGSLKT